MVKPSKNEKMKEKKLDFDKIYDQISYLQILNYHDLNNIYLVFMKYFDIMTPCLSDDTYDDLRDTFLKLVHNIGILELIAEDF